jgi:dCMP deaminase
MKKRTTARASLKRPSWDEYFMGIAELAATRSSCLRRHVGAVIALDHRVVATGYNGSPSGMTHCLTLGCLRDKLKIPSGTRAEICRGLHAEQNALMFARGTELRGATLYCTNQPCVVCAKLIIQSGIRTVVFKDPYPDDLALSFFKEAGLKLFRMVGGVRVHPGKKN